MSTTSKSRKKMARRKSISDILAQTERIMASGGGGIYRSPGRHMSTAREWRVVNASNRYVDNISGTRQYDKDSPGKADNRKYSRRTYMGLNAG